MWIDKDSDSDVKLYANWIYISYYGNKISIAAAWGRMETLVMGPSSPARLQVVVF